MRLLVSMVIACVLSWAVAGSAADQQPLASGAVVQMVPVSMPSAASAPSPPPVINRQRMTCEPFGCFLFGGDFATERSPVFSPEYVIAIGDKLSIKLWGGVEYEQVHQVDAQGNIFLPKIGPVKVAGVKNRDLTAILMRSLRTVYVNNVSLYAGLLETQPVMVYVSGGVTRPGAYGGTSANSLMYYLDRAGGIDPASGSYLDLSIIRGSKSVRSFNLYDFALKGEVPAFQFSDGDTILVGPRRNTVKIDGLVANPYRFEFSGETIMAGELLAMAAPKPEATHMRITRNKRATRDTEYFPLASADKTVIHNGDDVTLLSDKQSGTITVRIEGEHTGSREIALPYGVRLADVLTQIRYATTADKRSIQLFRSSVAQRQKEMLLQSLRSLEVSVLTARSATAEEAKLRKDEADLFLKWIERAKEIQPKGQVVVTGSDPAGIILENGDILRIPSDDALIFVQGEVLFPSSFAMAQGMTVADAIDRSGGYTQRSGTSRVVVISRDGSSRLADTGDTLQKGDEVLVLPRVETKFMQFAKDIITIIYQTAVSAAVVLKAW